MLSHSGGKAALNRLAGLTVGQQTVPGVLTLLVWYGIIRTSMRTARVKPGLWQHRHRGRELDLSPFEFLSQSDIGGQGNFPKDLVLRKRPSYHLGWLSPHWLNLRDRKYFGHTHQFETALLPRCTVPPYHESTVLVVPIGSKVWGFCGHQDMLGARAVLTT